MKTPDPLRPLKLRLYREAVRDGTVPNCWLVARTLGAPLPGESRKIAYHSGTLTFLLHTADKYVCVWYRGIPVCLTRRGHWFFLPGPWTDYLGELAATARHAQEAAEANPLHGSPK